ATAAGRALSIGAAGAGVVAMVWVGAPAAAAGELSGPMLALLVLLPLALADVLLPLADAGALGVRTRAAAERLAELERREPAVTDPPEPTPLPPGPVSLVARGLSAAWADAPALAGASFDLAPGRHLGVVGPSGSGKSTLAAVLLRFLAPTAGTYSLGGVDSTELTTDDVLGRVGLLHDDPHLFASTLAENVRLARPGASDRDVEWALRCAHLGDWLDALPAGLQTRLGDGG
ncbi:MAG: ATP-binding cassette domain-containing protein, partial [Hydrogenophaga sp.]